MSTLEGAYHCSIYATFQKIKTQFLNVMSTNRAVDITMFLEGCGLLVYTLYTILYIRMKAWYDAENGV